MCETSEASVLSSELNGLELGAHNLNELARECLSGRHKERENAMYYLAHKCLGEQLLSNKVTMKVLRESIDLRPVQGYLL